MVSFALAEYADLDHGYAATTHKAQSVTVDRTHVLATPGMDRHLAYVALTRHRHAVVLHWSEESFGSLARFAARLGRERAKDTTLDYAEPELDPVAAYAERRGLDPLAPASEIVVGDAVRPRATARGRLRRAQLASVLQSALSALRAAVEQQAAIADKIAAAIRVGRPDAAPAKPDGYEGTSMHILDDMTPPRQRPRDHVVRTELEEPKPPQPPAKDPQILALEETGHLVVQAWIELERTEAKTLAAQDWCEWSKAWDGLKALGTAIKREKALD